MKKITLLIAIFMLSAMLNGCTGTTTTSAQPVNPVDSAPPQVQPTQAGVQEQPTPAQPANETAVVAAPDGKTLLETRCSACHDLKRVENSKKSVEEWKSNVDRMVSKGAQLTPSEIDQLVAYLAATYPK